MRIFLNLRAVLIFTVIRDCFCQDYIGDYYRIGNGRAVQQNEPNLDEYLTYYHYNRIHQDRNRIGHHGRDNIGNNGYGTFNYGPNYGPFHQSSNINDPLPIQHQGSYLDEEIDQFSKNNHALNLDRITTKKTYANEDDDNNSFRYTPKPKFTPETVKVVNKEHEFKEMGKITRATVSHTIEETRGGRYHLQEEMCHFMENSDLAQDHNMMEMSCRMYKSWGENMVRSNTPELTSKQKSWMDSLGSRSSKSKRRGKRSLRKEYRSLSDDERARFHRAMNVLKNTYIDETAMYDLFVLQHQAANAPGAHFGPGFLGFHRELLLRFENALKEVDESVSIPYWDSNLDHVLGEDLAVNSVLWTSEFLGNGEGEVTSGPFRYWTVPVPDQNGNINILYRNLTNPPPLARTMPALTPDHAIIHLLNSSSLRDLTWFVSPTFESNHGAVHNWVGGVMAELPISPSDPVFFLHHAFIDCLWEQFRRTQVHKYHGFDPQYDYPNDTQALGVGLIQPDGNILQRVEDSYHYALNPMHPFDPLRNIDGLSNIYFDRFYSCKPSPYCSASQPSCGSGYFFCDLDLERCIPKLKLGTVCTKYERFNPCYKGQCCGGLCQENCQSNARPGYNNRSFRYT